MDYAENLAKTIVESIDPDIALHFVEDQSHSVADFVINRSGKSTGILEVTLCTREQAMALHNALKDPRYAIIDRKVCQSDWYISIRDGTRLNQIGAKIEPHLRDLEIAGIKRSYALAGSAKHPSIKALARLGVECAVQGNPQTPGLHFMRGTDAGWIDSSKVWEAADGELQKPDNLKKLRLPGATESHFFVLVSYLKGIEHSIMLDESPPSKSPALPRGITHVWIACEPVDIGSRVWRGTDEGWTDYGFLKV